MVLDRSKKQSLTKYHSKLRRYGLTAMSVQKAGL